MAGCDGDIFLEEDDVTDPARRCPEVIVAEDLKVGPIGILVLPAIIRQMGRNRAVKQVEIDDDECHVDNHREEVAREGKIILGLNIADREAESGLPKANQCQTAHVINSGPRIVRREDTEFGNVWKIIDEDLFFGIVEESLVVARQNGLVVDLVFAIAITAKNFDRCPVR